MQELRVLAKDHDVPYQSLLKILLAEKVAELSTEPSKRRLEKIRLARPATDIR